MNARASVTDEEKQLIEQHRRDKEREATEQRENELALLRRARAGEQGARAALLKTLSHDYESPIVGVIRVTSDPPDFHLLIDEGKPDPTRLRLGGIEVLDTQTLYSRAFLLGLGWKPPRVKPPAWDTVVTQLASCADEEDPDEATTDAGRGRRWIAQHLAAGGEPVDLAAYERDHGKAARNEQARLVAAGMHSFRDNKGVHVFLPAVQRSVRQSSFGGENATAAEVARCLKAAGCTNEKTKFPKPHSDELTTLSTWIVLYD